jgi:hypothetical protein
MTIDHSQATLNPYDNEKKMQFSYDNENLTRIDNYWIMISQNHWLNKAWVPKIRGADAEFVPIWRDAEPAEPCTIRLYGHLQ